MLRAVGMQRACAILAAMLAAAADAASGCAQAASSARIAIAGGSLTEIVYFLGAEERIVAVDSTSDFPAAARQFPSVGYVRNLSAEGLLSLAPTLVLGEDDMGPPETVAAVERSGIDIVRVPESRSARGILGKVRCVAAALGLGGEAEARIAAQLMPKLDALDALAAAGDRPRAALLLQMRDGAPIGAGRETSGDSVLALAGAANVFASFDGWKPISVEAMVHSAPDFVVVSAHGAQAAGGIDALLSHPALRVLGADEQDRRRRLIVMDGMALLGFGPRTLDSAATLGRRLRAPAAAAAQ